MEIFVEAVHRVTPFRPEVFDRWVRFYDETAVPAMRRHGYDLIGAWRRATGAAGEDVVLIHFESLAAFEQASSRLTGDEAIAAGMLRLREEMPDFGVSEVVKLANPAPGIETVREAPPGDRHLYLQVRTRGGSVPALIEKLSPGGARTQAGAARTLVTAYQTRIGIRAEVTSIWMLPGGAVGELPLTALGVFGGELANDEQIDLMVPLSYSPLR